MALSSRIESRDSIVSDNSSTFSYLRLFTPSHTGAQAYFVVRNMLAGVAMGSVVGLTFALLGGSIFGTGALPFMVGSVSGYAMGAYSHWRITVSEAIAAVKKYPDLMLFHTKYNHPRLGISKKSFVDWSKDIKTDWWKQSVAVIGLISASQAIEDIKIIQEAELVEKMSKKYISNKTE